MYVKHFMNARYGSYLTFKNEDQVTIATLGVMPSCCAGKVLHGFSDFTISEDDWSSIIDRSIKELARDQCDFIMASVKEGTYYYEMLIEKGFVSLHTIQGTTRHGTDLHILIYRLPR